MSTFDVPRGARTPLPGSFRALARPGQANPVLLPAPADIAALLDLARTIDPETTHGPAALVLPLRAALSADEVGLVVFERRADGFGVEAVHGTPRFAAVRSRVDALLAQGLDRLAFFDPLAPDDAQQNVPLTLRELGAHHAARAEGARQVLASLGLAGLDLLRALVCARGEVLLWIGAFRREPFGTRERAVLASVVTALRDRAAVERRLRDGRVAAAGLPAALEALPGAAFVVRPGGVVVHANAAGRDLLRREASSVRRALGDGDPRFALTPLTVAGLPPHYLALERAGAASLQARLHTAAARWLLTPRETQVLALLAGGVCNKDVAASLGCAEATVERHVTALLGKSGCAHRSAIVARFWTDA